MLLAMLFVALTGCTASQGDSARSSSAADCLVEHLAVSVDAQLSIHVRNAGAAPCRFAGHPVVQMLVGRIEGVLPSTDVTLPAGQEFIQPQTQVPGKTACSQILSFGGPGKGRWTVSVGSAVVHVPAPDARFVVEVVNCWVVTLPPGQVVEAAPRIASTGIAPAGVHS